MATFNGNIGTPSGGFNLKVDYNLSAVNDNISTNATKIISIVGQVKRNNSSYYPYNDTKSASIKIERQKENGQWETVKTLSVTSGSYSLNNNNYQTWVSGTNISISHKNNGTQKIRITFSVDGKLSNYYPVGSISKEIELPTIPRASDIAIANSDLGQNIPIIIGKKVDTFTNTLTYTIGTLKGTIVEKTNLSNYPWVMGEELISQIKNAYPNTGSYAKGGIETKVTCKTYNGNTLIGSKEATFKLYITDKPVISSVTRTELNSNILALTTNVLRHASQNKFTISANAPTGATITGYRVKNGTQDSGLSTSNVVNLNDIQTYYEENNALKTKFIVICVDSRGNESEEYPVVCDFINYIQVSINKTDVALKRSTGTSTDCKLYATGNFYNGKFGSTSNVITFKYRYKLKTSSTWGNWTTLSATYTNNTFIINNQKISGTFDYKENYDFELIATDKIGSKDDYTTVFATSVALAKYHKNGAWIRELSTDKLDAKAITDNFLGLIIEKGNNEKGSWIKFADGTMICRFTQIKNIAVETAWGSLYGGKGTLHDYPQEFVGIPDTCITLLSNEQTDGGNWAGWLNANGGSDDIRPTNKNFGTVGIARPTKASYAYYKFSVIAIGRWK